MLRIVVVVAIVIKRWIYTGECSVKASFDGLWHTVVERQERGYSSVWDSSVEAI